MLDLNKITIGEAKELAAMFGKETAAVKTKTLNRMVGKEVIIRTYSAGVWFGMLVEKEGNEVILVNARRMWQWFAADSISLSGCAIHGINGSKSRIAPPVSSVWLEAIEILECSAIACRSIGEATYAKAQ